MFLPMTQTPLIKHSHPHFERLRCVFDLSHMIHLKCSPTEETSFCFQVKVTLCANEGWDSNSSSEEDVKYSVACFLTGRCSHPKIQEQNSEAKNTVL